jgi:dTDP-4-amino-4,6-dideoxygalactose transaminase
VKIPEENNIKKFNWYLYTLGFIGTKDSILREHIKKKLIENGIGVAVYYDPPVHLTPYYLQFGFEGQLPSTEWASKCVLSLPVHPFISEADIERIVDILKKELSNFQ